MKNPIYTFLAATLAAAMSVPALAQEDGPGRLLEKFDKDGDGRISLAEFQPARGDKMLEQADANEDGMVTLEEAEQHHQAMMEKRVERMQQRMEDMQGPMREHFKEMDANSDGAVTMEEARQSMFSRIDSDGDGYLTPQEFRQARKQVRERRHDMHDRRHHGKMHSE